MDGHRKCGLCLTPEETNKFDGICPVCGKKITIGVSHRVEELADRAEGYRPEKAADFESLVPLPEVIGSAYGCSAASKKVVREYESMLQRLGPEFEILRKIPLEEIQAVSGHRMAEGIARLRRGKQRGSPALTVNMERSGFSVRRRSRKQKGSWISLLFLEGRKPEIRTGYSVKIRKSF